MISKNTQRAYLGAGCFWGVEERFRQVPGVVGTAVGYMGGETDNPNYEDVCTDTTGHAEVVEVIYKPEEVSYDALLNVFWHMHDPTQHNRQGPDIGTQYRSAIFYTSDVQHKQAVASKEAFERSGAHTDPIVTEITPAGMFHKAEEYHQRYLEKRRKHVC